jgi:hypothetical protein
MTYPIPAPLRAAASTYLNLHLREQIAHLGASGDLETVRSLCERGRA